MSTESVIKPINLLIFQNFWEIRKSVDQISDKPKKHTKQFEKKVISKQIKFFVHLTKNARRYFSSIPQIRMSNEEKESLFLNFGYDAKFVKETLANAKLSTTLYAVLKESGLSDCKSKETANALREIASKKVTITDDQKSLIIKYAATQKIVSKEQLEAAYKYFKDEKDIKDTESFDKSCGVGVIITKEILTKYVAEFLVNSVPMFKEYSANFKHPNIMNALREGCPFGGGDLVKIYMAQAPAFVKDLNIPAVNFLF